MSYAFPQAGLDFLRDLEANNSKEWFQANKKRYERELKRVVLPGANSDTLGARRNMHLKALILDVAPPATSCRSPPQGAKSAAPAAEAAAHNCRSSSVSAFLPSTSS